MRLAFRCTVLCLAAVLTFPAQAAAPAPSMTAAVSISLTGTPQKYNYSYSFSYQFYNLPRGTLVPGSIPSPKPSLPWKTLSGPKEPIVAYFCTLVKTAINSSLSTRKDALGRPLPKPSVVTSTIRRTITGTAPLNATGRCP